MRLAGAPRQGEPDWRKVRLLVLDRDDQFRFWIRTVFGRVHVLSIITAATPREAVEQMVGAFPTVALIELYHQDTVGIDFLRNLRNRRISPIPELPVIMVARTHDKVHLARASSLGVETVLVPPVAEIAVLAAVTQAVMAPRHVTPRVAIEQPRRSVLPDPVVLTAEPARVQAVKAPVKPRERAEAPATAAPPPPRPRAATPATAPATKPPPQPQPQPVAKRPAATVPPLRSAPAPAAPKPPPKPPVAPVAATPAPVPPAAQPKPMLRVPMEAPPRADAKPGPELVNRMRAHEVWLRSHGAQGTKADFAGANFTGQNLTGVNFMQVDLREAKLVNADLTDASLTGADLRDADLSGARLIGANLGVARLRHARMRVGDLDGANLRGADLSGANLTGARFGQADLTGAVFLETIINDADLSEVAGLTQKQLQRAWGNARTLLPSGLTVVERPS